MKQVVLEKGDMVAKRFALPPHRQVQVLFLCEAFEVCSLWILSTTRTVWERRVVCPCGERATCSGCHPAFALKAAPADPPDAEWWNEQVFKRRMCGCFWSCGGLLYCDWWDGEGEKRVIWDTANVPRECVQNRPTRPLPMKSGISGRLLCKSGAEDGTELWTCYAVVDGKVFAEPCCRCCPGLWSIWGYCWCWVLFNTSTLHGNVISPTDDLYTHSPWVRTLAHTHKQFNCCLM